MSANPKSNRTAWEDRWSQPSTKAMFSHLGSQHRRTFESIKKRVEAFDGIEESITYCGSAWNWTMQFELAATADTATTPFCFLIPKPELPEVCVPLDDEVIRQLPMRRLNRYIRDGIRVAKHALHVHWATWTPSNQAEVGHLAELFEQKYALMTEGAPTPVKPRKRSKTKAQEK